MIVEFWEKPGCMGNARQKALLATSGCEIVPRSLPDHPWTRQELSLFLDGLPVNTWFNRSARRIKDGEIDPDTLDTESAWALLLADPILVRRPLVKIGEDRHVGFDLDWIEAKIGHLPSTKRINRVRGEDLNQCPAETTGLKCGDPRPEAI